MNVSKITAVLLAVSLGVSAMPAVAAPAAPPAQAKQGFFAHQNGPLRAVMIFIPAAQVREFDKPPEQAPHVSKLSTVAIDEDIALKIMFVGPQLDASGAIDVTYDIRIIGPDGEVSMDLRSGLEAARGPAGNADYVFDNRVAVLQIAFTAEDPKGVYRAEAVLHDNIAGRDLPMVAEIELK